MMAKLDRPDRAARKRGRILRALGVFLLCYGVLGALFVLAAARFGAMETLAAVSHAVEVARPYLHAAQIATLIMLWWKWAPFVDWLATRKWVSARAKPHVLEARNRILLMLCAIQLFVVMGFPFRYFLRS